MAYWTVQLSWRNPLTHKGVLRGDVVRSGRSMIVELEKKKRNYAPPPDQKYAKVARQRGREVEIAICAWVRRWGYSSDSVLSLYYPGRPRIGYELEQRGLLKRRKMPDDVRCETRHIYQLTEEGRDRAAHALPYQVLNIAHSDRCPFRTMQHHLELQKIAIIEGMHASEGNWRTDPETRATSAKNQLVPDLTCYFEGIDEKHRPDPWMTWFEYERTGKERAVDLNHWVQLLARRQERAVGQRDETLKAIYEPDPAKRQPLITSLVVYVSNLSDIKRYQRAFSVEMAPYLRRTAPGAKPTRDDKKPKQLISSVLDPIVSVKLFDPKQAESLTAEARDNRRESVLSIQRDWLIEEEQYKFEQELCRR